jgi:hypothetical protein
LIESISDSEKLAALGAVDETIDISELEDAEPIPCGKAALEEMGKMIRTIETHPYAILIV